MASTGGIFRVIEQESVQEEKQSSFAAAARIARTHHMEPGNAYGIAFWVAVGFSQIIGIICIALIIHFANLYGGFGWSSDPNLQFSYHPVLMVVGLIFFYGDSIIVYRALSFLPKPTLKIIHASLHFLAFICSSIALAAVFENHRRRNLADLYSLHSWVGLAAYILFCLQYLLGFVTFLFPGLPADFRAKTLPFHTFFGVAIFILSIGAALMGMTERLLWTANYTSGKYTKEGATGNTFGIFVIVFGFLIVFLSTRSSYKRKPLPNEVPSTAMN
ncbi:Cytochrome b561, partial [Stegodyphus mimosarum]